MPGLLHQPSLYLHLYFQIHPGAPSKSVPADDRSLQLILTAVARPAIGTVGSAPRLVRHQPLASHQLMRSPFPSVLKRRLVGRRRRHGGLLLVHPQEGDMFGAKEKTADSRLQAVLVKLTGVLPKDDLGNQKIVSSDIIESVLGDSTPLPVQGWTYDPYPVVDDADGAVAVDALAKRLECELRAAKRTHLDCTEVLLPCGLLRRISRDIFAMAESEPCGLRGCTLYLCYENEDCKTLTTGTLKCDPTTASTFELYLTLKLSCGGWNSFLPQFIRNLTRGGSVVVSPAYTLSKKKLYRSYVD